MTIQRDVQLLLRAHLEQRADRTVPDGQLAAVLDQTARRRQRPAWLAALRSPSMTVITLQRSAAPRAAWLIAAGGLLLVALAAAYLIAGSKPAGPPVNGQIVFGRFDTTLGDTVPYIVNPDGSGLRKLVPFTAEGPFWSPDGRQIGLGHAVINADGTGLHTFNQQGIGFHVECWDWSPDGKRMLCEGFSDDPAADVQIHGVYTVRASDGGDLVRLTEPGEGGLPSAYSPDGTLVLWLKALGDDGSCQFMLMNSDGTDERRIGTAQGGCDPTWAPDGHAILASLNGRLYSIDVATGKLTQIRIKAQPGAQIWRGQWSPDGSRILIKKYVSGSNIDLFTMLPDGTDLVQVTNNPDDDRFFDWGTHPLEP
jgi:hypothetical protein